MDGSPEPSQTTKSNDGDHKESRAPSSRLQDTQGHVAEGVTSYSSPSSVGLSSSVPGPTATHSKTSQPHKDSSVDHLPLPLPPAEPYEAYLCRLGCSSWPSSDSRPDSVWVNAVDPSPSRPDTTTGAVFRLYSPLPRPFPRYDGPPEEGKEQCMSRVPTALEKSLKFRSVSDHGKIIEFHEKFLKSVKMKKSWKNH